jgi:cytochrome P450 family 142 subfamily A polypeptide 1
MAAGSQAFMEYSAYLHDIIEDRRRHPREDLVSILVSAKDEGVLGSADREIPMAISDEHQRLANDELIMILVLLMVAGNETTRNAISGGMHLLLTHPDERQKLLDDPAKIPAACEEIVRLISPVRSFGRTATEDTELRGRKIAQGDSVLLLYPSANRDAEKFEDPDAFRVDRHPEHLGFGIGQHFCLGANLARMELRVAFSELLRRLPDMELACERPEIKPSPLVHSYMHMPVRFTPERRAAAG